MQPAVESPAWPSRLMVQLNAADERTRALFASISPQQLNWKPQPTSWSMGQCLEHLCLTNELYLASMSASLGGTPSGRVEEIVPGWFSRWFIASFVEPSPGGKRARAPRKIAPASRVDNSVLDRFLRSHDKAREVINRARDYDVNRIRFWNPFLPGVRFTIGVGLEIICKHDRRHLLQAERVKGSADFPM